MAMQFANVWERVSDTVGDNIALINGDNELSWSQLDVKAAKIATILESITFSFINNVAKKVAKIGAELPIAETSAREDNVRDVNQKYKASALIIDRIK